jgi:hypothetical protein
MRLRSLAFLPFLPILLLGTAQAQVQSWEKLLGPGLVYRMEIDLGKPLVVHSLRIMRPNSQMSLRASLAKPQIHAPSEAAKGRDTLSNIVKSNQALAGINGDFFPWTGDPLGVMIRDGELLSRPFGARSAFAWGPAFASVGKVTWEARTILVSGEQIPLTGLNEEVPEAGGLVLNTPVAGHALSKTPATHIVLAQGKGLPLDGILTMRVERVVSNELAVAIGPEQAVLTVVGPQAEKFSRMEPGELVIVNSRVSGFDWEKVTHVIGGGPVLLKDGTIQNAFAAEGFGASFANDRHPRTAIGATQEGDILLVVVDGRQTMSRGASLAEMATVMKELGAVTALNLDGGGSSQLQLGGIILNRPSEGTERTISNNILLFGEVFPAPQGALTVRGVPRLKAGQSTAYSLVDEQGNTIPNGRVAWSAQGSGWIDQSGVLRTLQPGKVTVRAWVGGKVFSAEVTVE